MKQESPRDIAASVHARLKNLSRIHDRPVNELLQYYAIERFIERLARTEFAEDLILKGALLLRAHGLSLGRPTRDIDFLGGLHGTPDVLIDMIEQCHRIEGDDGISFDPGSIKVVPIRLEDQYGGSRLTFSGCLGTARIQLQIDVGIGDVVYPAPIWIDYPSLLDSGILRIRAYTLESVIAEKYHALVTLGLANSRLKDFYDLHLLAATQTFEGYRILEAIRKTFERRRTALSEAMPIALTEEFWGREEKSIQWKAFIRKNRFAPIGLDEVCNMMRIFFDDVRNAFAKEEVFLMRWLPGGPWRTPRQ